MDFFSRSHELAEVQKIADGTASGPLIIIGPRGSGKSAILKRVAATTSVPLISVRGREVGTPWPKSGLFSLLEGFDSTLGTSSEAGVAEALRRGSTGSASGIAKIIHNEISAEDGSPRLVLIDDFDLLDPESRTIIDATVRSLSRAGIRTVLTMSPGSACQPPSDLPKMVLDPLDTLSMIELGRSLVSGPANVAVLEHAARASAGSPLALKSILEEMPADVLTGGVPLPAPVRPGRALTLALRDEISQFSPAELTALQYMACAPFLPVSVYERLGEMTLEGLDALLASRTVLREKGRLVIASQVTAASIYWGMSAPQRLRLHEQIHAALLDGCPGLRALQSSFIRLDSHDVDALLDAAIDNASDARTRAAVAFAERAILLSERRDLSAKLCELAMQMFLNAEFNLARRYLTFAQAEDGLDVPHPVFAFLTILLDYVQDQRLSTQILGLTVREHAASDPFDTARMLCAAALCHLERWELDDAERVATQARGIVPQGTELMDAITVLIRMYSDAYAGIELPTVDDMSSEISTIRDALGPEAAAILMARVLSLSERYTDARVLLSPLVHPVHSSHALWTLLAGQVELSNELRAGRFDRARASFARFDAQFHKQRHFEVNHAHIASVMATLDGDPDEASAQVRRARLMVPPGSGMAQEAQISVRQARVAMSQRKFDVAAEHFRRARNVATGLKRTDLLRFRVDYVITLMRIGESETAREVLEEFRRLAEAHPSGWARRGVEVCEAVVTTGQQSIATFRNLFLDWDDDYEEFLRARALFEFSDRLGQLEYLEESEQVRKAAVEVFREIGIDRGEAICVEDVDSSTPSSVLDVLTEKELDVVKLLVRGAKNQTIAHELYVSVRTVELRLTNIFRKVGVKSRFDLMKRIAPELDALGDGARRDVRTAGAMSAGRSAGGRPMPELMTPRSR